MDKILFFFNVVIVNRLQICTYGVVTREDKHIIQLSLSNGVVLEEPYANETECKKRFMEITGEGQ